MSENDQNDSQDNEEMNGGSQPDALELEVDIDEGLDTQTSADDKPPVEAPRELTDADREKLAELDEALEKYQSQKRWSDVIRTIRSKADIVVDPIEKAALLREAGEMYLTKSSNQAEAIKCYELLIEICPDDEEALGKLRQMYEKRRDWAKLIDTMKRQAEFLPIDEQAAAFEEMAQIASKRVRDPDVCIALWQRVMEADPEHGEALESLSKLLERAKQWEDLAGVLSKLSDVSTDEKTLKGHLQKLGTVLAEKLADLS